ncbi:hypothetical protein GCM10027051_12260 [Niabella terrae]
MIAGWSAKAQHIESFYINLYTDSLKKGTHNYINVDGKMSNGRWKPLTSRELVFKTDYGKFEGNDLILPEQTTAKKVQVSVALKSDSSISKKITIWIKQQPDPPLPAYDRNAATRKSSRKRSLHP